ncbi:MAG: hypothetical protein HDS00_05665 [Bacteroides sp.]|nr:hypothetical protein [Bacteroides sp.]
MNSSNSRITHIIMMVCGVGGFLFSESCSKDSENKISISTLDFQPDTLPELVAEDVWYPKDSIYTQKISVFDDDILLVKNKVHDGPFLEVYNLNDSTLITTLLPHGAGPNEFTDIQISPLGGNTIQISELGKNRFANLNILSLKDFPEPSLEFEVYPVEIQFSLQYHNFEDKLLAQNMYHFFSQAKNISQPEHRFLTLPHNQTTMNMPKREYWPVNVNQGFIAKKPDDSMVWFVSRDSSLVEIYNKDLQLVKVIKGPVDMGEPPYHVDANQYTGMKDIAYFGGKPIAYYDCVYDSNRIALLYYGKFWNPFEMPIENLPSYIFVMDWEGNLQRAYKAPAHLFNISLSKDPNVFYATIADEDDNPKPIKLTVR